LYNLAVYDSDEIGCQVWKYCN